MQNDTIAAVSTALSEGGIGIIRISGPDAVKITDRIFVDAKGKHPLTTYHSHTIHYGFIENNKQIVDEVMLSLMKGPRSYTKEDTVEINCHGGVFLLQKVLKLVLENGARLAEPGEFTKRAFLNGRIDLTQAEAVMDLIRSGNDFALSASLRQLQGSVKEEICDLRAKILYEIAFIESALDDPEHIQMDKYPERLSGVIRQLKGQIKKLTDSFENGRVRREGIRTVIVGKPNAGKSSFLNLLAGEERAIVTDIPGTTRDALEESVRLWEICLNVVDTAGIRESENPVEKIGVERAKRYADQADLIVYMVDSSLPLDENDEQIMELVKEKKVIVLLNKNDLPPFCDPAETERILREKIPGCRVIRTSMSEKSGMEAFVDAVREMFFSGEIDVENDVILTNARQEEGLRKAFESLEMVEKSIRDQMPEDFYSIDLMNAYSSLGTIIGEEVGDDLVEEIFSRFCMGK